jgi:MoxR-like ATPase
MNSSSTGLTTFEIIKVFAQMLAQEPLSLALMLWSLTGVGKSAILRQTVTQISDPGKVWKPINGVYVTGALEVINDWGLVDLRTALMEPTDLRGLPDLKQDLVRWVVPDELPVVGQEDRFPARGVVFLDELTHAQPAMWAVVQRVVAG